MDQGKGEKEKKREASSPKRFIPLKAFVGKQTAFFAFLPASFALFSWSWVKLFKAIGLGVGGESLRLFGGRSVDASDEDEEEG